jgi:hypothetical protein
MKFIVFGVVSLMALAANAQNAGGTQPIFPVKSDSEQLNSLLDMTSMFAAMTDERKIKRNGNSFVTCDKNGKELTNRYNITTNSNNSTGLLYDTITHVSYVVRDIAGLKEGEWTQMERMNPMSGILFEKVNNQNIYFYAAGAQMSMKEFGARRLDGTSDLIISRNGKESFIIRDFPNTKTGEFLELNLYVK